jgi:hypothetical protein
MASIILVHGIDNQQLTPDGIEAEWLPALAGGVRLAGGATLADRLWPARSGTVAIECRVAYYGDLFRTDDQQGGAVDLDELSPELADFARGLALEWLERTAQRGPDSSTTAKQARLTLDLVRDPQEVDAQGIGNLNRQILKTLARNPWIAKVGIALAERFVVTALTQVSRYLSDNLTRALVQQRVLDLVEDDTRAIIGHSLGSVVVYECAHRLTRPLPLLVTLGSPLGLRSIVNDRLCPAPSFPPCVVHWLNVADRDDVVAAEPALSPQFTHDMPERSSSEDILVDNGSKPHHPCYYLGKIRVGRALIQALS